MGNDVAPNSARDQQPCRAARKTPMPLSSCAGSGGNPRRAEVDLALRRLDVNREASTCIVRRGRDEHAPGRRLQGREKETTVRCAAQVAVATNRRRNRHGLVPSRRFPSPRGGPRRPNRHVHRIALTPTRRQDMGVSASGTFGWAQGERLEEPGYYTVSLFSNATASSLASASSSDTPEAKLRPRRLQLQRARVRRCFREFTDRSKGNPPSCDGLQWRQHHQIRSMSEVVRPRHLIGR